MAMHSGCLIQDQNFLVPHNGTLSNSKASKNVKNGTRKAASKKVKNGTRKALSDISNFSKPHLHRASKKNLTQKFSVAAQEALPPFAEECFLHNHKECIKEQTKAMDIDECLMTVGLDKDLFKGLASPFAAPPVWSKLEPESPSEYLELEEIPELLIEPGWSSWKHELSGMPASPSPFKTPRSLSPFTLWKDCDVVDFKLRETPEVKKN